MHDVIFVGLPLVAILVGILLNQQGLHELKTGMGALRSEMNTRLPRTDRRINRVQAGLPQLYRTPGEHDKPFEVLERRDI